MLRPAEAEAAIVARLARGPSEELPLSDCAGRILRQPVRAERDAPPFDRVTMDGIAFARSDARAFRIAGVQPAGVPPRPAPGPGACIEVMTGAVLPPGCDTVLPVEQLRIEGDRAILNADASPEAWRYVHRRGSDARAGEVLLAEGARLGPAQLAIAASAGLARLKVSRRPRIAVITTGDELVEPGDPVAPHQVRRSNAFGLAAALRLAGFPPDTDLHLPDREEALAQAFAREIARHDALVLSGGVSAGRYDLVPAALESAGVDRVFHRVAQRPGRPLWFGMHPSGTAVFGLPGNPVSVLVCLVRYVLPALDRLVGAPPAQARHVRLSREFDFQAPLSCFLPVALQYDRDGEVRAEPRPTGGSGDFISLAGTDGFVELPPGPARHAAGTAAPYYAWPT